jgi:diacylglycerol kinase family enzyme
VKVALFHNPKAGDQDRTERQLIAALRRNGYEPTRFDLRRTPARKRALKTGEFVIVAGGDGSVKQAALALAGTGRTLAILPMGTANNIARSLGITGRPEDIIAGWKHGTRLGVDLGRARGPWGERYFIESLGLGLIGRAIAILDRIETVTGYQLETREDRLFRDVSVLLALAHELQPVKLRLGLDGGPRTAGSFLLCEVLNIRRSGPGVELSASADAADGLLDVVAVQASERGKLKSLLERSLAGKSKGPLLRTRQAKTVTLTVGRAELRLDDEVVWPPRSRKKFRPISVKVTVVPGLLECLIPRLRR